MQLQNGREVTICFTAHSLHRENVTTLPANEKHERNYSTSEREALAEAWASENFKKFLLGRRFMLQTDHSALQQLLVNPGRDL